MKQSISPARVRILVCALLGVLMLSGCGPGTGTRPAASTPLPADSSPVQDTSTTPNNLDSPVTSPHGPAGPLSADEISFYQNFLNQSDVYGFLLSSYVSPVDADFGQVFYSGAGVAQQPDDDMLQAYLDALGAGEDEIFGDVFYVTADDVNTVIKNRTGYTLTAVLQAGGNTGLYYLEDYDVYFQMAGDTNRVFYTVTGAARDGNGTVTVESRTALWPTFDEYDENYDYDALFSDFSNLIPDDEWESDFITTFRETDGDPIIVSNSISGWLAEIYGPYDEPVEITAQTPPFDAYTYFGLDDNGYPATLPSVPPETADPLPITLEPLVERMNDISDSAEWMAHYWDEWMQDEVFAAQQRYTAPGLLDIDYSCYYGAYNDDTRSELSVSDAESGEEYYSIDFSSYLYPNGQTAISGTLAGLDAQYLRWALIIDGTLYVANSHPTYAETTNGQNAYLTAVNLMDGAVLWRSEPLVCNSRNFDVCGVRDGAWVDEGVLLCGYGFTDEDDYLYQISMATGRVLDRTPLATAPDYIVYANGIVYVHCYDRDYEFAVSYG